MSEKQELQIKIKDEDLKGAYSNLMRVSHSKEEFILDFFVVSPPSGALASRVIVNPSHFKRMIGAFQENLEKYEGKFGKIECPETPQEKIGFTF